MNRFKILLGVSGSIAAFKAAALASEMVKSGLDVRVALTPGGARFVTPLTFEALTANPVAVETWDEQPGSTRMGHLELARWADAVVVAPASAGVLARLALGLADDMLTSAALASAAPLVLAPAMETAMWRHPATQDHVASLQARGATVVGPERGRLASGAEGEGRMAEPAVILEVVNRVVTRCRDLAGLRVLITAGPTYEAIDPVRFLGNRSSGKMGYAIAEEAVARGADVILVSGPTALPPPASARVMRVESTEDMRRAVLSRLDDRDVVVMAAAIADFRPANPAPEKIKRRPGLTLELVPNPDLAAEVSAQAPQVFHVGFALETGDLVPAAQEKMRRKGQDLVVANRLSEETNPFGSDSNLVTLVTEAGVRELPRMSKREVARVLWDEVVRMRAEGK